jgi:hypothetical protein
MTLDGGQPQLYAAHPLVDAIDLGVDVAQVLEHQAGRLFRHAPNCVTGRVARQEQDKNISALLP